jgi:hypothetical protein
MVCSLEAFVLSQYLQAAVVSSAVTGSDVTVAAFKLGALHPLSFVLTPGNAVVCRKAISVYATAGGTAAMQSLRCPLYTVTDASGQLDAHVDSLWRC